MRGIVEKKKDIPPIIGKDICHVMYRLVSDIELQATRKNRANLNKVYLITDLEIVEKKANELLEILRTMIDDEE